LAVNPLRTPVVVKCSPSGSQAARGSLELVDVFSTPPSDGATASTLLARWAGPDSVDLLVPLLAGHGLSGGELRRLVAGGGVLVLCDVALPPSSPPLAVAAFDLDRRHPGACLRAVSVDRCSRRRGLGRRLLDSAMMLLRSQGFEEVEAAPPMGSDAARFLEAVGFQLAAGPSSPRLVYWL
jgi:GNAT superfamily N-acetyltransferase